MYTHTLLNLFIVLRLPTGLEEVCVTLSTDTIPMSAQIIFLSFSEEMEQVNLARIRIFAGERVHLLTLHLGVVSQVGSEVHNLKVGDRVWFVVPYCVQGSLANFLVLDRDFVRLLPSSVSFEGGATLPYSGMVAWDMLVTCGGLGPRTQSRGLIFPSLNMNFTRDGLLIKPTEEGYLISYIRRLLK